jgi:hypothetical protein
MERTHVILLAILVVAGTLLGLRLLSPASTQDLSASTAGGAVVGPNGLRDRKLAPGRVAMSGGGERDEQKAPPVAPPPAEERRGVRKGSAGANSSGGGAADVVSGVARRRDVLAAAQARAGGDAAGETVGELADPALAGRTGAVAPSNGRAQNLPPAGDPNKRQTLEFVDDNNKPPGGSDVLLSLPFNGEVKPEVGGGPISSDGLVSHGGEVEFTENAQLTFPVGDNVKSSAGTISFDIKPTWDGGDETNNSLVQIRDEHVWENSLEIVKNYGNLRFILRDSSGVEHNLGMEIPDWAPGESRRVDATWSEDPPAMALYVNGQLVGEMPLAHPINFSPTTPIHIGSDFPNTAYSGAGGTISNFTVFGRALGAQEIAGR